MKILLISLVMLLSNDTVDLSPQSVYEYCVEQDIQHPEIVTAQAIQESGWFKCTHCSLNKNNIFGFWYSLLFAVLIIIFSYFYTAITIPTNKMADDLKRGGGFVPGIRPGKDTADYLDTILSRITLPGSIFLALLAVLPAVVTKVGVQPGWAIFYGGTSLLIIVGVAIDTLQQINAHLLNRHYDGLMKAGSKRKVAY